MKETKTPGQKDPQSPDMLSGFASGRAALAPPSKAPPTPSEMQHTDSVHMGATVSRPTEKPPVTSFAPAQNLGPAPSPAQAQMTGNNLGPTPAAPRPLPAPQPAPARAAALRPRHRWLLISLILLVVLPVIGSATYLFKIAHDQYASRLAFSVRSEETSSAIEILGGFTELSGSSGSDTDILFEFIQSQELVRIIDNRLDLHQLYYVPEDPWFSSVPDGPIEDLTEYWNRMIKVYYDQSSGLIEIRVLAFEPESAQTIAAAIYEESSAMINRLSAIAREDTIAYARADLDLAVERLRGTRQAVSAFRLRTQIVDPEADLLGRMGILNELQAQLATAQIELDILNQTTHANDPRVTQASRRVAVIRTRISEERERFSSDEGSGQGAYANLVGEYERLSVDREFAEATYLQALAAFDAARAEANRQTRYLAAYVNPTLPESSGFPERYVLIFILAAFLFGSWAIVTLVFYSIRDRR